MLVKFKPEIIIDKDLIFKRMRIDSNSPTYKSISETFNKQVKIIENIVEFESVYLIKENNSTFNIKNIDECEKIAYCFTSIGKEIVNKINEYFFNNDYLEGYLLNELADELVMSSSRQMYQSIKKLVKKDDYNLTKRYSPGECGLDIKFQATVMNELKSETKINAHLTESYMIVPEKSTLFIYGIDKNIPESVIDHDCSQCTREDCPYKK